MTKPIPIIRASIEKYLDASDEMLYLFGEFLNVWKERTNDIDVIEARKIFAYMIQEDQKKETPVVGIQVYFSRHCWVVGEYASNLARKLTEKNDATEIGLSLSEKEIEYVGGSHDIGKLLSKTEYQHAHEHAAWLLMKDNGCSDLASIAEPHQPGEETVLKKIHGEGDFLDVSEEEFCRNRPYALESDLIMLADMSCGLGYDGAATRMADILKRYDTSKHIAIGMNDPERGVKRVLEIEKRIHKLLEKD